MKILRQVLIQALESALEQEQEQDRTVAPDYVSTFSSVIAEAIEHLESGDTLEIQE